MKIYPKRNQEKKVQRHLSMFFFNSILMNRFLSQITRKGKSKLIVNVDSQLMLSGICCDNYCRCLIIILLLSGPK